MNEFEKFRDGVWAKERAWESEIRKWFCGYRYVGPALNLTPEIDLLKSFVISKEIQLEAYKQLLENRLCKQIK